MWCTYTKTFVFRDCFDDCIVDGNVDAIRKLMNMRQVNGNNGVFITTDILSVSETANDFGAYQDGEDGSWNLKFYKDDKEIAIVPIWSHKEVHLCFEIEEDVRTDEFKIHYCNIKAFKDYQL